MIPMHIWMVKDSWTPIETLSNNIQSFLEQCHSAPFTTYFYKWLYHFINGVTYWRTTGISGQNCRGLCSVARLSVPLPCHMQVGWDMDELGALFMGERMIQCNVGMRMIPGWWFESFLDCSISYMGCHPSHWRTHICQNCFLTTNQLYNTSLLVGHLLTPVGCMSYNQFSDMSCHCLGFSNIIDEWVGAVGRNTPLVGCWNFAATRQLLATLDMTVSQKPRITQRCCVNVVRGIEYEWA
jgi:hypothetical protein